MSMRYKGLTTTEHAELGERLKTIFAELEATRPILLNAYGCKFEGVYRALHAQLHKLCAGLETQLANEIGGLNVEGKAVQDFYTYYGANQ
jgi:hypothetical protein